MRPQFEKSAFKRNECSFLFFNVSTINITSVQIHYTYVLYYIFIYRILHLKNNYYICINTGVSCIYIFI